MLVYDRLLCPEIKRRRAILRERGCTGKLGASQHDDEYGAHHNAHALQLLHDVDCTRTCIVANSSPIAQICDTDINPLVKTGIRKKVVAYQQERIAEQLADYGPSMQELEEKLISGTPIEEVCSWKAPKELSMQGPSRGQVILWSRQVRAEYFNVEKGHKLIAAAYYKLGLVPSDGNSYGSGLPLKPIGSYLMFTEYMAHRKKRKEKDAAKKRKKHEDVVKTEKGVATELGAVLSAMSLSYDVEQHYEL